MTEPGAIVAHDRRSIRLSGYDYGQAGAYFVTICTQDRVNRFGVIADGTMRMNDAGQMVHDVWDGLPSHYPGVAVDAFVVMPSHVHGIILLGRAQGPAPTMATRAVSVGTTPRGCPVPATGKRMSLPDAVHRFKSFTTARYRAGVRDHGWPAFDRRLWQRNYHEHIIRNDAELARIRRYIVNNPAVIHSGRQWPNQA